MDHSESTLQFKFNSKPANISFDYFFKLLLLDIVSNGHFFHLENIELPKSLTLTFILPSSRGLSASEPSPPTEHSIISKDKTMQGNSRSKAMNFIVAFSY